WRHCRAVRALHVVWLAIPLDPLPFERRARRDPAHAALVARRRGLRVPMTASPFEALVWAVLGQQINLAFVSTLRGRLVELAGRAAPVAANGAQLYAHPTPAAIA